MVAVVVALMEELGVLLLVVEGLVVQAPLDQVAQSTQEAEVVEVRLLGL